jgi:hypothetical protein
MVTIWNPADEPQDFVFTLSFDGGHYRMPVHLEDRATHTFNISESNLNQKQTLLCSFRILKLLRTVDLHERY